MDNLLDKAAEAALKPLWQITITSFGKRVQITWSKALHPEAVPVILMDQAKQILEGQFAERRKDTPLVVVPKFGNGGG